MFIKILKQRIENVQYVPSGLEIATDTVANATKTFPLVTKTLGLVAIWATVFV